MACSSSVPEMIGRSISSPGSCSTADFMEGLEGVCNWDVIIDGVLSESGRSRQSSYRHDQ